MTTALVRVCHLHFRTTTVSKQGSSSAKGVCVCVYMNARCKRAPFACVCVYAGRKVNDQPWAFPLFRCRAGARARTLASLLFPSSSFATSSSSFILPFYQRKSIFLPLCVYCPSVSFLKRDFYIPSRRRGRLGKKEEIFVARPLIFFTDDLRLLLLKVEGDLLLEVEEVHTLVNLHQTRL